MRQLAHLLLAQMTESKPGLAELVLSEAKEEITLIAGMVHAAQQTPALAGRVELNSRIVPSSDGICAHLARRRQQLIKLQVIVAQSTRNWRVTGQIRINKWPHHFLLEALLMIH